VPELAWLWPPRGAQSRRTYTGVASPSIPSPTKAPTQMASHRDPASPAKNRVGVILAEATMWPRTSLTVQGAHKDGVAHSWSLRDSRSAASARRSAWVRDQGSVVAIVLSPLAEVAPRSDHPSRGHPTSQYGEAQTTVGAGSPADSASLVRVFAQGAGAALASASGRYRRPKSSPQRFPSGPIAQAPTPASRPHRLGSRPAGLIVRSLSRWAR
jgi:hypothetical protein